MKNVNLSSSKVHIMLVRF